MSQKRPPHPVARMLGDLFLGVDPKTRVPIGMQLLATLLYACWAALVYFIAIPLGLLPRWFGHAVVAHQLIVIVTVYPLVRSGLTQGWPDPYLSVPQTLWAGLALVTAYAVAEPARPIVLQTLCMVQVFGFLGLQPRSARLVGAAMIAMLMAMLGAMCLIDPPGFSPLAETLQIAITSFIIALLAWQSSRFARFRQHVSADKQALKTALAEVARIALLDGVTGLPNRQALQQRLEAECERTRRTGSPFCVALIDLDHFKRVNDTHGHAVGDEVLAGFAKAARDVLRESDVVGRWGGEEFVVLLLDTVPGDEEAKALERLRRVLDAREVSASAPALRVRFSAGMACAAIGEPQERLMARADKALYEAKAGGRNRICVAGTGPENPAGPDAPPASTAASQHRALDARTAG